MQEGFNASPTWIQIALGALASFLAGGGIYKIIDTWLNRKKPAAEIHVTEATAAEIHVRAGSTAGDAIMRFMTRLDEAQVTIDRLRAERDAWQDEYDKAFTQRDQLIIDKGKLQSEVGLYKEEVRQMRLTLESNHLNYDNTQDKPIQNS